MISKDQARTLAVAYQSFHEARDVDDAVGTRVWAGILNRIQEEIGVHLTPQYQLNHWMNYKRAKANDPDAMLGHGDNACEQDEGA